MKRILYMIFKNILLIPYIWIKLCRHAKHVEQYSAMEHFTMLKYIVKRANKGGNVTIRSYGQENIPKESGFIFYPNHQGLYDVLALIDTTTQPFSVVSKIEMKNTPFLKQVFQCIGVQFMDRDDIRQSLTVIKNVANEVADGKNYVIFPEGTRSKNGNHPGEFKSGSFKAATMAKCPIVPVALINAFLPFDRNSIKQAEVQIYYLPPISYEEYKNMKTTQISAEVQRRIEQTIAGAID